MRRSVIGLALACCVALPTAAVSADQPPTTWDGLELTPSKKLEFVYLLKGADFKPYTKIILDPTEVAFRKNWQQDWNDNVTSLQYRITDDDARQALATIKTGFQEVFATAYRTSGYTIVTQPGHDVMRVKTMVMNLDITAPDPSGFGRSYARDAGQATLVLEVRDSMSNALLGRAIDRREAGAGGSYSRTGLSNRNDFRALFQTWAKASIDGLNELKTVGNPAP